MTDTSSIQKWLATPSPDWDEGVALFVKNGGNSGLANTFLVRGYSVQRMNDLRYQLSKLSKTPHSSRRSRNPVSRSQPTKLTVRTINTGEQKDDPVRDDLVKKKNNLLKEYYALFHQLEFLDKIQRGAFALRILSIWRSIRKYWEKIDFYDKYKILPPDPIDRKTSSGDRVDLMRRLLTLRTYITKYEKKLQSVSTAKARDRWQTKLDEYGAEKMDIEKKLNS